MKKIMIFGGTFNPVHNGHVYMCRMLADNIGADDVYIVPTFSPVHKDVADSLIDSQHRLNMCEFAFDRSNEHICDFEIKQGRGCYSFETISWFKERFPDAELYFACGSDMFLSLHTWRNPKFIFDNVTVCAISREDDYSLLTDYAERYKKDGLKSIIVTAKPMIVSSTEIRNDIKSNGNYDGLPSKVAEYIKSNGLYL